MLFKVRISCQKALPRCVQIYNFVSFKGATATLNDKKFV